MNDTIDKLRRNFATGMTSARISDDEWRDVFLPVIEDAEKYFALRKWVDERMRGIDPDYDAAMSATTEESK